MRETEAQREEERDNRKVALGLHTGRVGRVAPNRGAATRDSELQLGAVAATASCNSELQLATQSCNSRLGAATRSCNSRLVDSAARALPGPRAPGARRALFCRCCIIAKASSLSQASTCDVDEFIGIESSCHHLLFEKTAASFSALLPVADLRLDVPAQTKHALPFDSGE